MQIEVPGYEFDKTKAHGAQMTYCTNSFLLVPTFEHDAPNNTSWMLVIQSEYWTCTEGCASMHRVSIVAEKEG